MEINLSVIQGHYDWAHPSETQDNARLMLPTISDKPLNLSCPVNSIDHLRGESWDDAVPVILETFIKGTLWSSNLDVAKKALEWAQSDEGQNELWIAWAKYRLAIIKPRLKSLKQEEEKLERGLIALEQD